MDRQQLNEAMSKAEVETTDVVGPERRAFLMAVRPARGKHGVPADLLAPATRRNAC